MTTRAYINSYQELWRLVLKLKDEKPNAQQSGRPTARQLKAEQVRAYLNTLASAKSAVTFLDGRTEGPNSYSSHTVVVEFPRTGGVRTFRSQGHYEGNGEVVLRSTAP